MRNKIGDVTLDISNTFLTKNIPTFVLSKTLNMGLVYAEIELINGGDMEMARRHLLGEEEIRRMNLTALVDTGSYMFCINESIQEQMQFPVVEKRKAETADGRIVECDVVNNVEIRFKNRATSCRAMVLPDNNEPLLGAIPLEDMPARLPHLKLL